VREDLLIEHARQFFALRVFGPDRAALLREQLPASAAEAAARRHKETARLRKRLCKIDTTEDAHVREVRALAELDPNSPAVKAMRERHLRAFTALEAERDDTAAKLAALAGQADDHGGNPALLDDLPILGDLLPRLPGQAKARLFEAFDLTMIYSKTTGQVTSRATITPATPTTLAAIITGAEDPGLAALLNRTRSSFGFASSSRWEGRAGREDRRLSSGLARHPGMATSP
jgi:site-specific DNA recombinase